jgi:two-component system, OmpR family, KDP operon response regulator KdpE
MNRVLPNLLIAESDRVTRMALRALLANGEFTVIETTDGEEALALAHTVEFDAALLGIDLSDIDTIEVCRLMRESWPQLPIIILTVKEKEDRNVQVLEAGADDFITLPFQRMELIARLRRAVRRSKITQDDEPESAITIDRIHLDPMRHSIEKEGRAIRLTPKEFDLLHYLMAHAGRPIPHARLLKSVWGPEYGKELEYLRTFIRQIRKKIEDDPANPKYVVTDPRIGYRFMESEH